MENGTRINKYLASTGISSRRGAEKLIEDGRVTINGRKAVIGDKVSNKDIVLIDGEKAKIEDKFIYIMLHKPRGFVTTMADERGRRCVKDLVADIKERVYPVGRLDKDSEGLLFMTNDGDFANYMMHPSKQVDKTYRVTVAPGISDEAITTFSAGMQMEGYKTTPARVKVLNVREDRTIFEITIHEGKNRQIRNMCEKFNMEVLRLKRISEGGIKLGMLPQGKWRELTKDELKSLGYKIKSLH